VLGLKEFRHTMDSGWFSGECTIMTYELEELLGTKLRALYQRRKGRDLFDLYQALNLHQIDTDKLIKCYQEYMQFVVDKPPTQKQFILNMDEKMKDKEFNADIMALLRPGIKYNNEMAYEVVNAELIEKLR
jgi:predicted nucleotidyltransferase component of viral defense system